MAESYCLPCIYYGKSTDTCDYILLEDRRRPCPGGKGCIVRRMKKEVKKTMGKPKWDTQLGMQMWLEGKKDKEIAEHFGIAANTVTTCRRKYWEKHKQPPPQKKYGGRDGAGRTHRRSGRKAGSDSCQYVHAGWCVSYSGRSHQNQSRYRSDLHRRCNTLSLELGQRRRPSPCSSSYKPPTQALGGVGL